MVNSSPPSMEGSVALLAEFLGPCPCWVKRDTIHFEVSVVYDQEARRMVCLEVADCWVKLWEVVAFVHYQSHQDKVYQALVDQISDAYTCHTSSRTLCSEVPWSWRNIPGRGAAVESLLVQ